MPKKRQIRFLHQVTLADGTTVFHWKPSARLRRAGFVNVKCGTDRRTAWNRAEDLNDQVTAWEKGAAPAEGRPARPIARIVRFGELVDRFQASPEWAKLKPKTRAEYGTRLRQLLAWAQDGALPVAALDRQMVRDLRQALLQGGSAHRTAAILRVLRLLLSWAVNEGIISSNPALKLRVPEAASRQRRLIRDDLHYLESAARAAARPHIEIAVALGFYTCQREGDLLNITRFTMRQVHDISGEARRALQGADGRVLALRLEQGKTGQKVEIALVPVARAAIERIMPAMDGRGVTYSYLVQHPGTPGQCPEWRFQRDFRATAAEALTLAVAAARAHGRAGRAREAREALDAARRLKGIQFRDLRRSGMCWMRDLGVPVALIASVSGHSIEQTQKILDTYLPRDTRATAEAMAMAVTRQAERDRDQAGDQQKEQMA